jgi:REP element-mobilizing transposase RayT
MPIGVDTYAYGTRLPHLVRPERLYYVTFCTYRRQVLSPAARDVVLDTCRSFHEVLCWIDCLVVMPDHVHMIVWPYEEITPSLLLGRIKGRSSYDVNRVCSRKGRLWQRDSFDRIVRSDEKLDEIRDYIFNNPVRAGIVKQSSEYRWMWWSGGL